MQKFVVMGLGLFPLSLATLLSRKRRNGLKEESKSSLELKLHITVQATSKYVF